MSSKGGGQYFVVNRRAGPRHRRLFTPPLTERENMLLQLGSYHKCALFKSLQLSEFKLSDRMAIAIQSLQLSVFNYGPLGMSLPRHRRLFAPPLTARDTILLRPLSYKCLRQLWAVFNYLNSDN